MLAHFENNENCDGQAPVHMNMALSDYKVVTVQEQLIVEKVKLIRVMPLSRIKGGNRWIQRPPLQSGHDSSMFTVLQNKIILSIEGTKVLRIRWNKEKWEGPGPL